MVSRTAQLPNVHLRKEWQKYVKTWFNQPARKLRRRLKRQEKVARRGVTPVGLLRPSVHAPTQRYNMKIRAGRGFTLDELKAVGISPKYARSIGIAVDHRRQNRSHESLQLNRNRLKNYLAKLILFQRGNKAKKGIGGLPADTPKSQGQIHKSCNISNVFPCQKVSTKIKSRVITEEDKKFKAFATLRNARACAKNVGKHKRKDDGTAVPKKQKQ